jgi:hypothetical protein
LVCTTRGSNHEGETYSAPDLAGQLPVSLRLKKKKKKKKIPQREKKKTKQTNQTKTTTSQVYKWALMSSKSDSMFLFFVFFFCARPASDISKSKTLILPGGKQKVK